MTRLRGTLRVRRPDREYYPSCCSDYWATALLVQQCVAGDASSKQSHKWRKLGISLDVVVAGVVRCQDTCWP